MRWDTTLVAVLIERYAGCNRIKPSLAGIGCAPLLYRGQKLLTEVIEEVRKLLPLPLLGFHTDNDTILMSEPVRKSDHWVVSGQAAFFCRSRRKARQTIL
jgi:hypothetical protein